MQEHFAKLKKAGYKVDLFFNHLLAAAEFGFLPSNATTTFPRKQTG